MLVACNWLYVYSRFISWEPNPSLSLLKRKKKKKILYTRTHSSTSLGPLFRRLVREWYDSWFNTIIVGLHKSANNFHVVNVIAIFFFIIIKNYNDRCHYTHTYVISSMCAIDIISRLIAGFSLHILFAA